MSATTDNRIANDAAGAHSLQGLDMPLTAMQLKLAGLIVRYGLNGSISTSELACRAKTSRLAAWSAMRSLEGKKLAGYFRSGDDQWAASMWFLRDELKRHISS